MKASYIRPTTTTISAELSTIMAGSNPQNQIQMDTENSGESNTLIDYGHTGNIGDAQGLDLMIEAARELKEEKISWYLVGDGRAKERLEKLTESYGLTYVHFVGRVSEAEANRYVHFADCAYLSFQNNALFNMMLPAKRKRSL